MNGIFIDVTEQKTAEAEASLQRQEVAHLMRVSVLGELSGAIAHEINQPLAAVRTNAETGLDLLAASEPDIDEIRDTLQDILHDNRRAGDVVQRLRSLLKKGERTIEALDVNDLVRSTVALLNSELIGRRASVRLNLGGHLPATTGDPIQLQQVLLNLLMNAMDAMAQTPEELRQISVTTGTTATGNVEIVVRDRGVGIRPGEESLLFQPFHTTKAHGLGLGLTICSTIAQAHGGTLVVANDGGGGAAAVFSLPAKELVDAAKWKSTGCSRSFLSMTTRG